MEFFPRFSYLYDPLRLGRNGLDEMKPSRVPPAPQNPLCFHPAPT